MSTANGTDAVDDFATGDGDDIIRGGGGNDRLRGGDGEDAISGGGGDDAISGGGGADIIYGGDGDDIINGGTDFDRAVYRGDLSDYSVFVDSLGRLHIVDSATGRDGSDTLQNIEEFNFNGTIYTYADLIA